MEEIDLIELLQYFKEKIGLIIVITMAVCIMGCIYGIFIQIPMYQSYTTVILGGNDNSNTTSITQNDITINKNLVSTYSEVVKSRKVLDKVIDELSLDIDYEELYEKVSVTSVNDTEIIKITVSDEDAVIAKDIANSIANFFTKQVVELYNIKNVNVLDEAIIADSPYNINILKQTLIFLVVGLGLACGIIFIMYYFDRTIKSVEQVEQKIKLPILGSVAQFGRGGRR